MDLGRSGQHGLLDEAHDGQGQRDGGEVAGQFERGGKTGRGNLPLAQLPAA